MIETHVQVPFYHPEAPLRQAKVLKKKNALALQIVGNCRILPHCAQHLRIG